MARVVAFEWHGKEYSFEQRTADWYWALGIVAGALIVISILFGDVLFALVIFFGAIAIALEAAKHVRLHRFMLTDHELIIDESIFPFSEMLNYSILEYIDERVPPALSIKTSSIFTPHLLVPLPHDEADAIYAYLLQHVIHDAHELTFVDRLMGLFRF